MGKKMVIFVRYRALKLILGLVLIMSYFVLTSRFNIPTMTSGLLSSQALQVLLIGLALGTDAFSVSVGIGMKKVCGYDVLKTSVVIGLFHVVMPLIGLFIGEFLGSVLGTYAKYIGSMLITLIGCNMIYESFKCDSEMCCNQRLAGWSLIILATSVSLDALTVGLGLGTLYFPVALVVGVFGILGGIMTAIGLIFGRFLGNWLGEKSEALGGVVLIFLGIKMLLS